MNPTLYSMVDTAEEGKVDFLKFTNLKKMLVQVGRRKDMFDLGTFVFIKMVTKHPMWEHNTYNSRDGMVGTWRFLRIFQSCLLSTWHTATKGFNGTGTHLALARHWHWSQDKHAKIHIQQGPGTSWQPHKVWLGCNIKKEWRLHADTSFFCWADSSQLRFETPGAVLNCSSEPKWNSNNLFHKISPRPA